MSEHVSAPLRLYLWLIGAFAFAPLAVLFAVSVSNSSFALFPITSLSLRWYAQLFSSSAWLHTAALSAAIALGVSVVTVAICLAAAAVAARSRSAWARVFEFSALGPMLIPHAAVAMVLFWLVNGMGQKGTILGIVFAHVVIVLPLAYQVLSSAMRFFDRSLQEAAMTLGASPLRVFWRVTLPNLRKPLVSAFILTWMLSFDEVTVTAFLVSIDRITLPVQILQASEDQPMPLLAAIGSILVVLTTVLTVLLQRLVGLNAVTAKPA